MPSMRGVSSAKYTSRAACGRGGVSVGVGVLVLGMSIVDVGVPSEGVGVIVVVYPRGKGCSSKDL